MMGPRLHLVDLDGARAGRSINGDLVQQIVDAVEIPCELGGGLRNTEAINNVLDQLCVEWAIVGTAALKNPDWFRSLTEHYPGKIILGIDARDGNVATEGWLQVSEMSAIALAKQYADLKISAIIYTNIANDGMMQGIDDDTINDMKQLCQLGFSVIASGGVTTLDDVRKLAEVHQQEPKLIGCIIGRALYEGTITVAEAIRTVNAVRH